MIGGVVKMSNARNWTAILYPEHLIDNWSFKIGELLEYPFVYCIHDKDTLLDLKSEIETFPEHTDADLDIIPDNDDKTVIASNYKRKVHIHIIISFPNTTTYNHALEVLQRLYKKGHKLSIVKQVLNIRYLYNYLIHDTDKCREDHKHMYDVIERIEGNDFDIGALEQIGQIEKKAILKELKMLILEKGFCNFADFTM